jgi:hypothetical protein
MLPSSHGWEPPAIPGRFIPSVLVDRQHLEVPLAVPTGQEREIVVAALVEQVRAVLSLLPVAGEAQGDGASVDISNMELPSTVENPVTS